MAPLPSRKVLESMRRPDLQRICKDYGVKANLKTEALIDLLLDTQSAPPPPQRRSVSTRQPSSKAGPSRVSSMIVHDIDEDDEQEKNSTQPDDVKEEPAPTPAPVPTMIPAPRTRKAKDLQIHLGVGKPLIAGGRGPRAVTRSSGSSKGRGLKASRSIKPMEATIEEEPEPTNMPTADDRTETTRPQTPPAPHNLPTSSTTYGGAPNSIDIRKMVEEAIRPLEEQIRLLKSEVAQIHTIKAEVAALLTEFAEVRKVQEGAKAEFESLHDLSTVVNSLKEELKELKDGLLENRTPSQPSTPKAQSVQPPDAPLGYGMPSAFKALATAPSPTRPRGSYKTNLITPLPPHPGIAPSTLGKRPRDPSTSNVTGVLEEGQEDESSGNELPKKVLRPTKKKPRVEKDDDRPNRPGSGSNSRQVSSHVVDDSHREASGSNTAHTFTVFRGSDERMDSVDPPPPINHIPDFFEHESPPTSNMHISRPRSRAGIPTSSANATENLPHNFGFSFLPISSTPQDAIYNANYPYPEPQSPTPAGSSDLGAYIGRHDDRADIFKSLGFPSPIRPTRNYGALTQDDRGVNPAALMQGSSSKRDSSTAADTRAVSSDSAASMADPPLTTKRTMYGTELEADTRFGDFGLDGMATSYWASGNY